MIIMSTKDKNTQMDDVRENCPDPERSHQRNNPEQQQIDSILTCDVEDPNFQNKS